MSTPTPETPQPKPRRTSEDGFLYSHRFWAAVMAVAGGLPTTGTAVAAGIALLPVNPVVGIFTLIGAGLGLIGTGGLAYFGFRAKNPVARMAKNGNGN